MRAVAVTLPVLAAILAASGAAGALPQDDTGPDFSTSTIAASRTSIHPLETIDYTITIRNTGTTAPSYLRVANAIPTAAMLVSASREWRRVESERELSWMGTLAPGASQVLRLSLIARPGTEGSYLVETAAIHYDGAYWAVEHRLEVETTPAAGGVKLGGGLRITTAGLWVFGYLFGAMAVGLLLVILFRNASRRMFAALAVVFLSGGFLAIFVAMARSDARMLAEYRETRCVVVDSMARYVESQSAASTSRPSRRSGSWSPEIAVCYPTLDGELVSVVNAGASRLQLARKATFAALGDLQPGANARCWYDPADPKKVVLDPTPGGAYLFSMLPLITLAVGLSMLVGARKKVA